MAGPLDLSTRAKAVDAAARVAGGAVDPFRRFMNVALAEELVLVASDVLLFHRAARAALAEVSLERALVVAIAARVGGPAPDEPANDAAPRPPRKTTTREQKLVLAAKSAVQRMAKYIAR